MIEVIKFAAEDVITASPCDHDWEKVDAHKIGKKDWCEIYECKNCPEVLHSKNHK